MKTKNLFIILLSILLFVSICLNVLGVCLLNIVSKSENSYASSNFYLTNLESLRNLSQNRFVIYCVSEEEDREYKIGNWTICVYSLKIPVCFGLEDHEGLNNYVGHNNSAALTSACHLLIGNQKEVGLKVIEVLSQISPGFRYYSVKRKPQGIAAIKQAALAYGNNNQLHESIIERIEYQWHWKAQELEWVLSDELRKGIKSGPVLNAKLKEEQKQ